MKIYTIGFTKKSASRFFGLLSSSGAKRIIDIRLNNVSQLAGFAKKDDLAYFAKTICSMDYIHISELAPTRDILDAYKKKKGDWITYENMFRELMIRRKVENAVSRDLIADSCLLCSEASAEHCHRRLVAEYLQEHWGDVTITHLM